MINEQITGQLASIELSAFHAWLLSKDDCECLAGELCTCPLARFVNETIGVAVDVQPDGFKDVNTEQKLADLPDWGRKFLLHFDCLMNDMPTTRDVLPLMRELH